MTDFAIFNYSGKAVNKGGPSGYLSHLYTGFNGDSPDFLFIKDAEKTSNNIKISFHNENYFLYEIKSILSYLKKGIKVYKKYGKTLNNYSLIHIHDSESVFYIKFFCRYKGKIILTSHRPEPLADEVINAIKAKRPGNYRILKRFLNFVERYSYKKSFGFIFPSPSAAAIYNQFPGFTKSIDNKPIKFVTTGLRYKAPTATRDAYYLEHNIKIDVSKKIVTYIGRHNLIKGYDRVIAAFPEIKRLGGTVIVGGALSNILYPDDSNWIELGYINDAINLMSISDVVVIPNRNTYFDLVIIEALSLGKVVITSNTGGNIDIASTTKGLYLFDNKDEKSFTEAIKNVLSMKENERKDLEKTSRDYYLKNCTPAIFASNYIKTIREFL